MRTDLAKHRPLPADSDLAQAIAVLARAQQDAVWDRTQAHNKLRSHLRQHYPEFLHAFASLRDGIMRAEARLILTAAPTPAEVAKLTKTQLAAPLRRPAALTMTVAAPPAMARYCAVPLPRRHAAVHESVQARRAPSQVRGLPAYQA